MRNGNLAQDNLYHHLVQTVYQQEPFEFVGVALQETTSWRKIRWRFAAGNTNQRFRKIVLRSGIGIAGLVIRTGEPFIENDLAHHHYAGDTYQPITLVEHLTSAVAVPIFDADQLIIGVLLAGYRHHHPVTVHSGHVLQKYLQHCQ